MLAVSGSSPCLNICVMDDNVGICVGCGRTIDEIAQWSSLSASEREAVKASCAARLERFQRAEQITV